MHEPIRKNIEEYLTRSEQTSLPAEFTAHLVACAECRGELGVMESQSQMVRLLRPEQELEPRPGFYARVQELIEAQRPASVWNVFLQPFGRRLATASLALALMMGIYMYSTEPGSGAPETTAAVSGFGADQTASVLPGEDQPGVVLSSDTDQDRSAVLANLASYREQ